MGEGLEFRDLPYCLSGLADIASTVCLQVLDLSLLSSFLLSRVCSDIGRRRNSIRSPKTEARKPEACSRQKQAERALEDARASASSA